MALGRPYWRAARETIQKQFSTDSKLKEDTKIVQDLVVKISDVQMHLPATGISHFVQYI